MVITGSSNVTCFALGRYDLRLVTYEHCGLWRLEVEGNEGVVLSTGAWGDGMTYHLSVEPGVPISFDLSVTSASIDYTMFLVEGETILGTRRIRAGGPGIYGLEATPELSGIDVVVLPWGGYVDDGGYIGTASFGGHWVTTTTYTPHTTVSTICSDDEYRYSYNGQMKVNEWAGVGNHTTALFWEYDTRTGRRANIDPVDQVSVSNYATNRDNPIMLSDPQGDCPLCFIIAGIAILVSNPQPANPPSSLAYSTQADLDRWSNAQSTYNGNILKGLGVATGSPVVKTVRALADNVRTKPQPQTPDKATIDPNRAGHIFRKSEGHLPNTPANQKLLEDVANNPANLRGTDKYGTRYYSMNQKDGSQVWVGVRNGKVSYGGVNATPKPFNSKTGFSAETAPNSPAAAASKGGNTSGSSGGGGGGGGGGGSAASSSEGSTSSSSSSSSSSSAGSGYSNPGNAPTSNGNGWNPGGK